MDRIQRCGRHTTRYLSYADYKDDGGLVQCDLQGISLTIISWVKPGWIRPWGTAFWQKTSKLNERGHDAEVGDGLPFDGTFRILHFGMPEDAGAIWTPCPRLRLCRYYNVLRFLDNIWHRSLLPPCRRSWMHLNRALPLCHHTWYTAILLRHRVADERDQTKGDGYIRLDVPGGW